MEGHTSNDKESGGGGSAAVVVTIDATTPDSAVDSLSVSVQQAKDQAAAEDKSDTTNNSSSSDRSSSSSSSSSDDASDIAIASKQDDAEDEDLQATPGHLHALVNRSSPARLLPKVHSDSKLAEKVAAVHNQRRRCSASRSVNSSRSSSPLRGGGTTNNIIGSGLIVSSSSSADANLVHPTLGKEITFTTAANKGYCCPFSSSRSSNHSVATITSYADNGSYSCSSLDGRYFDPDLLLDRLGFIDLDPPLPHEIRCGPLAAPGSIDGKSNNAGGLTPVNERLCDETLEDCHAFQDLVVSNIHHLMGSSSSSGGIHNNNIINMMSSTMSMPSVAHSSLSGIRSDMSVGSIGSALSMGSFTKGCCGGTPSGGGTGTASGGHHSREGSLAGGSILGDGELSVLLGTLDEVGEEEEGSVGSESVEGVEEGVC
jgi:hypothetical protein